MKKQKFPFTYLAILLIILIVSLSQNNKQNVEGFDKVFATTNKNIFICDSGVPEVDGKYHGYKDDDFPGLFEGWIKDDGSIKIFKTRNGWMIGDTKKPFNVYFNNTKSEFSNDNGIPIPPLERWNSNVRGVTKTLDLCYGDAESCCDVGSNGQLGSSLDKHFDDNKTKNGTSYTDLEYSPVPGDTTTQPTTEKPAEFNFFREFNLPNLAVGTGAIIIIGGLMYLL